MFVPRLFFIREIACRIDGTPTRFLSVDYRVCVTAMSLTKPVGAGHEIRVRQDNGIGTMEKKVRLVKKIGTRLSAQKNPLLNLTLSTMSLEVMVVALDPTKIWSCRTSHSRACAKLCKSAPAMEKAAKRLSHTKVPSMCPLWPALPRT